MGDGLSDWGEVMEHPALKLRDVDRQELEQGLQAIQDNWESPHTLPTSNRALLTRLLYLCPCLFTQIEKKVTPSAIVHLCEITMGERIDSNNIENAFDIQDPNNNHLNLLHEPLVGGAGGGDIMENLCSEVLTNHGVPHMEIDPEGWPVWRSPGHVSLNAGKMCAVKLYGDILIPAAPTNILISVKTQAARERLMVSGNRIESIGFGFFNEPSEFWTKNRMNLYKRMGFTALYMLGSTRDSIMERLERENHRQYAVNVNGTPLYRPLSEFGPDMLRVAGKVSLDL